MAADAMLRQDWLDTVCVFILGIQETIARPIERQLLGIRLRLGNGGFDHKHKPKAQNSIKGLHKPP
jgi:hypothetical protein